MLDHKEIKSRKVLVCQAPSKYPIAYLLLICHIFKIYSLCQFNHEVHPGCELRNIKHFPCWRPHGGVDEGREIFRVYYLQDPSKRPCTKLYICDMLQPLESTINLRSSMKGFLLVPTIKLVNYGERHLHMLHPNFGMNFHIQFFIVNLYRLLKRSLRHIYLKKTYN